jgi:formyltetrahydrofolate-dependent phosphoribosylglycinamide formyltransferase
MFGRLQKKWNVNGWRLVLILITFAVGGSLTGYAGKWAMQTLGIQRTAVYIPIYIIIITIIWPMMVLLVSVFTGQFIFFRNYLMKMGKRLTGNRLEVEGTRYEVRSTKYETTRLSTLSTHPKHITLFASGAGSNAQKIIDHFRDSEMAKIALIVCNKAGAGVIGIAKNENIPVLIIEKERFFRGDGYLPELRSAGTDLLVLAGFLWKIPQSLINEFPKRIINIHPALLPKYGGKGMYGQNVHSAVLDSGELQSGITIHYVDEHYDNGDIIFQTACPVLPGDSPETLAHRIHQLEHNHYPMVIEDLIKNL